MPTIEVVMKTHPDARQVITHSWDVENFWMSADELTLKPAAGERIIIPRSLTGVIKIHGLVGDKG